MLQQLTEAVLSEIANYEDIEVEYDFELMSHPTAPGIALWLIRNPVLYTVHELASVHELVDYLRTAQAQGE